MSERRNQTRPQLPPVGDNFDRKDQERLQKELLERITFGPDALAKRTAVLQTDSKLTTKEHIGKGIEPHKPDEQEALKTGTPQSSYDIKTVEVSSHQSGEATDTVVTEPSQLIEEPHPALHKHDAIGTSAVIREALGGDKKGAKPVAQSPEIVGKGPSVAAATEPPSEPKRGGRK